MYDWGNAIGLILDFMCLIFVLVILFFVNKEKNKQDKKGE